MCSLVTGRDSRIRFSEEGHTYFIDGSSDGISSVTKIIKDNFPRFNTDKVISKIINSNSHPKYEGMNAKEIKELWEKESKDASLAGTNMHSNIELYLNGEQTNGSEIEMEYFKSFWSYFIEENNDFKLDRTEWRIFDEDALIAGSVDCTLTNSSGEIIIIDWKRSKKITEENKYEKGFGIFYELDNCNYNHYLAQLNMYRHIIESKYEKNVISMFMVVIHPNNESYILYDIPRFDVSELFRKK